VSDDGAPKSAYELILERLKQKDRADGVEERVLRDEQKQKIAELRRVCEAKLAEREILHQAERRKASDMDALERLEQDYRRDRERITSEAPQIARSARARCGAIGDHPPFGTITIPSRMK
jgi:hypothetical protein